MKKVLSFVLVIAMVLSSMSFAFAGTLSDVADNDYEKAINALVAFGIISGYEDGTFRPAKEIKRAEIAKILVEALGYGDIAVGATSSFSDTQGHWADSWISIAAGTNLVAGYPDGTFKPEKIVTYDEILTMVVRALGYTDAALKGAWPTNFKVKALDLGLTKDVKMATANADRGGVAQVIYNSLEAFLVEVDADNKVSNVVLGQDKDNKVIYKTLLDQLGTKKEITVSEENVDPDSKKYLGDVVDLAPYMYQDVTVYTNKDGDVVYIKDVDSLIVEGEVTKVTDKKITIEDAKDKEYEFDATTGTAILLNGEEVTYSGSYALLKGEEVTVVLDAESDDRISDGLDVVGVIAKIATEYVQVTEEYEKDELKLDGNKLPVKDKKVDHSRLVITGDATSLEDIEEDDVIALYYGKGAEADNVKLEIVVSRDTVEGKITKIDKDDKVYVGGKAYAVNDDSADKDILKVGNEVILYLDHNGDIFAAENTDAVQAKDFALVLEVTPGVKVNSVKIADPKVKVLTAAGEKVTYVLDKDQEDGSDIEIKEDLTFEKVVSKNELIKINVNKDGEIDKAVKVGTEKTLKTTGNSFNLAINAVIFDVANGKVVKAEDLDDSIKATVEYDGAKIVALAVTEGVGKAESTYAVIVNNEDTVLDEDDEKVIEYTVLVEGKKVTYLGESATAVSGSAVNGKLVELKLDGGKIESVKEVNTSEKDKIEVTEKLKADDKRVSSYITVGKANYYLSDDVAVYVYEDGEVTLGSKSDIRDNNFVAYNLDTSETSDYSIVIVIK